MPICPRCKVAFLDGETHRCPRKSQPAATVWGCILAIYAMSAALAGSPFMPVLMWGYFGYRFAHWLAAGIGHLVANVLHAFAG